ncbi:hypothetical protein DFH09DRAFT_1246021 [Mycena vulgaris]|nr:hypothetical protein DFH09DRAFT_1246021 [Mycena vulgaris]
MGWNQHKPNSPIEDIEPYIREYWKMRKDDKSILRLLNDHHIDKSIYGLGLTRFREIHESLGLFRTRKQDHDVTTIRPAPLRLRAQYPMAGAREIISLLFQEEHMSVSRSVVTEYFAVYEAELVKQRRKNRLRHKRFWAAGVNDLWAVDQHDKWKYRFGLALHSGIDPFIWRIQWMKFWWSNSNPRLILGYYLDVIEDSGFMPLVSQSDPNTENFGLANGHTMLRHWHDPSLAGTLQRRWMREKKNVNILDVGVRRQFFWFPALTRLFSLVFRWVFIPWLQSELDAYRDRVNNTAKRADRNKVLPHGVPNDMYRHPENYGVLDFKIKVKPQAIEEVRALYASRDHDVFQLVPPDFHAIIARMHVTIGQPSVPRGTCWNVYLQLLEQFSVLDDIHNIPPDLDAEWGMVGGQETDQDDLGEIFAWFSDEEFVDGSDVDEW